MERRVTVGAPLSKVIDSSGPEGVERIVADPRQVAISLLARLGDEGTLAVIELLESDEVTLQQNAATILGHIGDVRARHDRS